MTKLVSVKPLDNYELELTYANEIIRRFDVKPYLGLGKFRELKEQAEFDKVRVSFDTICWDNGVDLCPDVLYQNSQKIN